MSQMLRLVHTHWEIVPERPILSKPAFHRFSAVVAYWQFSVVQIALRERLLLLHLRPSQKRRECRVLAGRRSTVIITTAITRICRTSAPPPNSDIHRQSHGVSFFIWYDPAVPLSLMTSVEPSLVECPPECAGHAPPQWNTPRDSDPPASTP
jgi:hypothetical protein